MKSEKVREKIAKLQISISRHKRIKYGKILKRQNKIRKLEHKLGRPLK